MEITRRWNYDEISTNADVKRNLDRTDRDSDVTRLNENESTYPGRTNELSSIIGLITIITIRTGKVASLMKWDDYLNIFFFCFNKSNNFNFVKLC